MIPTGPYTDIHTHILPGLDDGSQSMEETLAMLRSAYSEGVRTIVATPHCGISNPRFDRRDALMTLDEVREKAERDTPGLSLIPGNELYYTEGIVEALNRGEVCTIGDSSYALVEFGIDDDFERIMRCVKDMIWNGYKPVIAHLERYRCLEGDLRLVNRLTDAGAAIQINCRSFMHRGASMQDRPGPFRRMGSPGFALERKTKWAYMLLGAGLVHFIASDCHDDQLRCPVYRQTLEVMSAEVSEEVLKDIAITNPQKMLNNDWVV